MAGGKGGGGAGRGSGSQLFDIVYQAGPPVIVGVGLDVVSTVVPLEVQAHLLLPKHKVQGEYFLQ